MERNNNKPSTNSAEIAVTDERITRIINNCIMQYSIIAEGIITEGTKSFIKKCDELAEAFTARNQQITLLTEEIIEQSNRLKNIIEESKKEFETIQPNTEMQSALPEKEVTNTTSSQTNTSNVTPIRDDNTRVDTNIEQTKEMTEETPIEDNNEKIQGATDQSDSETQRSPERDSNEERISTDEDETIDTERLRPSTSIIIKGARPYRLVGQTPRNILQRKISAQKQWDVKRTTMLLKFLNIRTQRRTNDVITTIKNYVEHNKREDGSIIVTLNNKKYNFTKIILEQIYEYLQKTEEPATRRHSRARNRRQLPEPARD